MTPLSDNAIAKLAKAFCGTDPGSNLGPQNGPVFQKFLSIIEESPLLVSEIESFIERNNFYISGVNTPSTDPAVDKGVDQYNSASRQIDISFTNNPPPASVEASLISDTYSAVDGNNGSDYQSIVQANYYGGNGSSSSQLQVGGLSQIIGVLAHELGHFEDGLKNSNPSVVGSPTGPTHVAYGLLSEGVAENNNILVAEQIAENSFKDTGTPIDINVSIDSAANVASNTNLVKYYESQEIISPTYTTPQTHWADPSVHSIAEYTAHEDGSAGPTYFSYYWTGNNADGQSDPSKLYPLYAPPLFAGGTPVSNFRIDLGPDNQPIDVK